MSATVHLRPARTAAAAAALSTTICFSHQLSASGALRRSIGTVFSGTGVDVGMLYGRIGILVLTVSAPLVTYLVVDRHPSVQRCLIPKTQMILYQWRCSGNFWTDCKKVTICAWSSRCNNACTTGCPPLWRSTVASVYRGIPNLLTCMYTTRVCCLCPMVSL